MDQNEFTEAYSLTTGVKQRIPAHWLEDPVLGRDFRKTPTQRELDGELGPRPSEASTVKEIEKYAEKAGIEIDSSAKKSDQLTAIEAAFGPAEVQDGVVSIEPPAPAVDPLAPDLVAAVTPDPPAVSTTNTPADGDKEN